MCGLAGIADLRKREPVRPAVIRAMAEAVSHRGPDSEGFFIENNIGLAHRRLAIIDPGPSGHQPMLSSDERLALIFNGTIYNYHDLRKLLEKYGHNFKTDCDTEVLIHGWEQWGEDIVHHLNGHFVFVIKDRKEKNLYMVRDRYGTKPLYYCNLGGLWLFASEIKSILVHPAYSPDVNYDALCEYFTFQNLFRFHTLFKDIYMLPPANIYTIDLESGAFTRKSFWDYNFQPDNNMTEDDAREETQRLMIQAVKRQLFSDVPVGSYLSGGMDSGSIVSIASREIPCMHTFTCGWHMGGVEGVEKSFDERVAAELMADRFRTQHYEQVIGHSDAFWVLRKLVYQLEDLRLGMCYGNYYIARLASKFVKVCLSGAGGDELFGGYPWRYYRVSHGIGKERYFNDYFNYWQRLIPDEIKESFFNPSTLRKMNSLDMSQVMTRVFTFNAKLKYDSIEDQVANSLYFEAKTFLHGLLVVGDRVAMAHGLEERFPFLDNDLCDFAQQIPIRFKLRNLGDWKRHDENIWNKGRHYYADHNDGKNILREAMKKFVPEEIMNRRKQGFSSPDESWYRGPRLEYVRKLLLNRKALCHDYISADQIRNTIEQHSSGKQNFRLRIWSLLCFETWLKLFMDGQAQQQDYISPPAAAWEELPSERTGLNVEL